MNVHEYQAKTLFKSFGVTVPEGHVAATPAEAAQAARSLGTPVVVVKAQVHAGGRGKAGGVKLAKSLDEVEQHAKAMLGKRLVTHQSGHEGLPVDSVYVEAGSAIDRELYLSLVVDRTAERIAVMASAAGGMDIEEVAHATPEKILTLTLHSSAGSEDYQARKLAFGLGLRGDQLAEFRDILRHLVKLFRECDASLVEINPLILTPDGRVHALDAKVSLDDNSVFRHPEYEEYEATQVRDARERAAHEKGLQYVGLEGYVGIIANGAGLAMSTVDIVSQVGGKPANFLDIGGGANADVMSGALEVINNDPDVKAIFINIFGGITKGEEVANGIIAALERVDIEAPIVIRLDGTNAEEGRAIIAPHQSDRLISQPTMLDAARKAVELAAK